MRRDEIKSRLIKTGRVAPGELHGCSDSDVEKISKMLGPGRLPESYLEFLYSIGRGAGTFLLGTEAFFQNILEIHDEFIELLRANEKKFILPDDAFIFYMHQGYEFGYFLLRDGDDPPVYQYFEGGGLPKIAWRTFSDYMNDMIETFSNNP